MGLVQVAKAIAEGKAKVTVADLDNLIRSEEFLTEERGAGEQTKLIIEWSDATDSRDGQAELGMDNRADGEPNGL